MERKIINSVGILLFISVYLLQGCNAADSVEESAIPTASTPGTGQESSTAAPGFPTAPPASSPLPSASNSNPSNGTGSPPAPSGPSTPETSTGPSQGTPGTVPAPGAGPTCHNSDSNHACLALKYVVYVSSSGVPVVTQEQAVANVEIINQIWKSCNLSFQIDEFAPVKPKEKGLEFNTADLSDLNEIRRAYEDEKTLLVVTTGAWDRDGTLGDTEANAWTNLPGESQYGAILESPVGRFPNIIAHELGHYLDLDHKNDDANLMNPVIYSDSKKLTSSQCKTVHRTVEKYWSAMLR